MVLWWGDGGISLSVVSPFARILASYHQDDITSHLPRASNVWRITLRFFQSTQTQNKLKFLKLNWADNMTKLDDMFQLLGSATGHPMLWWFWNLPQCNIDLVEKCNELVICSGSPLPPLFYSLASFCHLLNLYSKGLSSSKIGNPPFVEWWHRLPGRCRPSTTEAGPGEWLHRYWHGLVYEWTKLWCNSGGQNTSGWPMLIDGSRLEIRRSCNYSWGNGSF